MQSEPNGTRPESLYALVIYLSDPLGGFLDDLRLEMVPGCNPHAHISVLPPRPLPGRTAPAARTLLPAHPQSRRQDRDHPAHRRPGRPLRRMDRQPARTAPPDRRNGTDLPPGRRDHPQRITRTGQNTGRSARLTREPHPQTVPEPQVNGVLSVARFESLGGMG